MDTIQINEFLIKQTQSFYDFSTNLARGKYIDIAPPFGSYQSHSGDIISYYESFFKRYDEYLTRIEDDVLDCVKSMMSELVFKVSGRVAVFDLKKDVQSVERMIIDTMVQYFKGQPGYAFEKFEQAMLADNMHLFLLLPKLEMPNPFLFRVRKDRGYVLNGREEMFHVPFDKRNKCGTYRYSTLGYPSLYLTHRIDVAKQETDIGGDDDYYAACFNAVRPLNLIDMSLVGSCETIWEKYSFLVFYPLIMACGLKAKNRDEAYVPEYTLPQIFLQVLRSHVVDGSFDGLSYISTRVDEPDFFDMNQRNYIIWITGADQEEGYSQSLSELFRVSGPLKCNGRQSSQEIERRLRQMDFNPIL